jgi:hypothetical protein
MTSGGRWARQISRNAVPTSCSRRQRLMQRPRQSDDRSAEATEPSSAGDRPVVSEEEERAPLFSPQDAEALRERWNDIQTGFVDEPRPTVERADELVAELMKRLAESFAQERGDLERQWDRGEQISTEDLRVTLRRYRSFFDRLLSV